MVRLRDIHNYIKGIICVNGGKLGIHKNVVPSVFTGKKLSYPTQCFGIQSSTKTEKYDNGRMAMEC